MKFKTAIAAAFAVALSCAQAFGQATLLPNPELCFQATTGINGMVGVLGTITPGSLYTNGTYGGVSLTGGSGSSATANITVSGGIVTAVAVLNPGVNYVVGDTLSASAASIGGTGSGFSVPVNSIAINSAVAGGTAAFYIPSTLTPKQTWQNASETVLNTNPVGLDSNGCAIVYGAGNYRVILKDSLGNTIFDQLTAATNGSNGIFWAALAGGTGNSITVTDSAFANQDGYNFQFLAKSANTGAAFISVSGGGLIQIVKDTSTGPAPLTGGEIGPFNTPMLTYDATNVEFHIVNPSSSSSSTASASLITPQGYLNLVGQASGNVIQTGDVIGTSTVYYSPFVGDTIPIWNGSTYVQTVFSELTATLTAAGSAASAIQDACVFSNNGVPTLAISPAWTTATAGAGNRGTGAGTPQITRVQGIWVNAVSITGYNGLSSFTIGASRCTYVGSLSIDGTAGQVTAHRTYGQSRKFGVWNAYNRMPIRLLVGDSTSSWTYNNATIRSSNNSAANTGSSFCGLAEEEIDISFVQNVTMNAAANTGAGVTSNVGIGLNSVTAFTGKIGSLSSVDITSFFVGSDLNAAFELAPTIGVNSINLLERGNGTVTNSFKGSNTLMQAIIGWRG